MPLGDQSAALQVKLLSGSRDITAATGSQTVSGVGFMPRFVLIFSTCDGNTRGASWGMTDGLLSYCLSWQGIDAYQQVTTAYLIQVLESGGTPGQYATIGNFNDDGFSLNWTKVGAPAAGTLEYIFVALR